MSDIGQLSGCSLPFARPRGLCGGSFEPPDCERLCHDCFVGAELALTLSLLIRLQVEAAVECYTYVDRVLGRVITPYSISDYGIAGAADTPGQRRNPFVFECVGCFL